MSREEYLAETQVHARRKGKIVQVFVQVPEDMKGIGTIYAALDLEVQVPAGLPVEVTDTSGNTTIEKVSGSVRIENDSSGDIQVAKVGRNVEVLADSSGRSSVSRIEGSVTLPTR